MFAKFFRRFQPRSLFARGLWMILLPIIVIQLFLGAMVVQRYFFQVIEQLNDLVIADIRLITNFASTDEELYSALEFMGYEQNKEPLDQDRYGLFDLSGRLIHNNFAAAFGEPVSIDSREYSTVKIHLMEDDFDISVIIDRSKLAPLNPHQILLNTLIFSSIFALVSILFLRNQMRSLRKLSRAAKAFGRGEVLDYEPTGADEVRSAGRSFLAMRNRIERQRQQRNMLLSGVSHDIRTPLTRIRLAAELIEDEATKQAIIDDIAIIDELSQSYLSYASNDIEEDFVETDVPEYLAQIAENYPKVRIARTEPIQLRLRPVLFRRAIENILANAERFAERIDINLTQSAREIMISVDDDGPGIAASERENALKAFVRLNEARTMDKGGNAGLGLAIAADAIRQHGGDLVLEKSSLGGLRAEIHLPKIVSDI